jgi:hypothetical protein
VNIRGTQQQQQDRVAAVMMTRAGGILHDFNEKLIVGWMFVMVIKM